MREPMTAAVDGIERGGRDHEPVPAPRGLAPRSFRSRRATKIVIAILLVTLVKQLVLVAAYPPFEGHDEVAHYGYVATLNSARRLPTLADNLPPETGPYSRFTLDWPAVYTANHPPLYYLLAWPLYRIAPDDAESRLYAMRLLSVPIFLLIVWLTYLLTLTLFPGESAVSVTAPALVAFQPQLSFEGAIVNNDILAMLIGAMILCLLATVIRRGATHDRSLLLGVMLGVGLLTKATLTVFIPIAVAVVLWRAILDSGRAPVRRWASSALRHIALLIIPAVIVSLPWFVFVYASYGDLTAFRALDSLQATWGAPSSGLLDLLASPGFHRERLHEAWGYFGWRLLPLSRPELWFVIGATAVALIGFGLHAWRMWNLPKRIPSDSTPLAAIGLLAGCCIIFYVSMVYVGTRIAFTQMRYVFPAAPAAAIVAGIGYRELIGERWRSLGAALVVAGAMLFQMLTLTRLVLPHGSL